MAEIYSSSEASSHSTLSPEDSDHIQSVLSDLGLAERHDATPVASTSDTGAYSLGEAHSLAATAYDNAAGTHDNTQSIASPSDTSGEFRISGLGDDTLAGGGSAAAPEQAPTHDAALSPDGTNATGSHAIGAATGAHDTLAGGDGMDTLWGSQPPSFSPSEGTAHADTPSAATATASDAQATSHAGTDTLHGAHAALPDAGDATLVHTGTDTLATHGSHDTLDGSASTHATTTDVFGSHSTIIGGDGNDTLARHDAYGDSSWSHTGTSDHGFDDGSGGHATLAAGTTSDHAAGWSTTESLAGGDGSDIYAMAHYGGYDTTDASGDGSAFHGYALTENHFAPEPSAIVTFGDGYGAHSTGIENIQSHDTVYNI